MTTVEPGVSYASDCEILGTGEVVSVGGLTAAGGGVIEAPGTANTGIKFYMSSGNIASGTITIFGIRK